MQTQKWVDLGILIGSLALYLFVSQMLVSVWDLARLPTLESLPVEPAYVVSLAVVLGVALWARRNTGSNTFLNEVSLELSRVTWPGRKETVSSAGVVIVLISIAAVILFLVDTLWRVTIKGVLSF